MESTVHCALAEIAFVSEDKKCYDCKAWCGRCLKGRKWPLASSPSCEQFEQKDFRNEGWEVKKNVE